MGDVESGSGQGPSSALLWASILGLIIAAVGMAVGFAGQLLLGLIIGFVGIAIFGSTWRIRREVTDRAAESSQGPVSLIQQRMRLDRSRNSGWLYVGSGVAFVAFGVVMLLVDPEGRSIVGALLFGAASITMGVVQLILTSRERGGFEREHGRDAGKQQPLGRQAADRSTST